jgi:hypothetical protein
VRLLAIGNIRCDRLDRTWDDYKEEMRFKWTVTAFVIVFGVVSAILSAWNAPRKRDFEMNLVRDGTPTFATIQVFKTPSFRIGPPEIYFLNFIAAGNRPVRVRLKGAAFVEVGRRKPGESVLILYDPRRPEFCRPYDTMNVVASGVDAT